MLTKNKFLFCIFIILFPLTSNVDAFYNFDEKNKSQQVKQIKWEFNTRLKAEKLQNSFGWELYKNITELEYWNFTYKEPLLHIPGLWIDYEFSLYYRTDSNLSFTVGNDWSFNQLMFIIPDYMENYSVLETWYNTKLFFQQDKIDKNKYISCCNKWLYYIISGDNITLHDTDNKWKYTFNRFNDKSYYELTRISDSKWNDLIFTYNHLAQLTSIRDNFTKVDAKNYINYVYYPNGLLQEVSTYQWDKINFIYQKNNKINNLTRVTYKKYWKIVRDIKYEYYTGKGRESLLKSVDDPYGNYTLYNKYDKNKLLVHYETKAGIRYYYYAFGENEEGEKYIRNNYVITRENQHNIYTFNSYGLAIDKVTLTKNQINEKLVKIIKNKWLDK